MSSTGTAFAIYVIAFVISFFISCFYALFFGKKTGQLGVHAIVAFVINLVLGILTITGWSFFARGDGFLIISGFIIGGGLLLASEIVLIIVLFAKRKRY